MIVAWKHLGFAMMNHCFGDGMCVKPRSFGCCHSFIVVVNLLVVDLFQERGFHGYASLCGLKLEK